MIHINRLIEHLGEVELVGRGDVKISELAQLNPDNKDSQVLFWCNDKNLNRLELLQAGNVIVSRSFSIESANPNCNYLIVENPRRAFKDVIKAFWGSCRKIGISDSSYIDASASLGKNVYIGNNVVIEEGCIIGDNCSIEHNSVICRKTVMGANCIVGPNCTIGGAGFGYERNEDGDYEFIDHIGNVVLHENVEIGSNSSIDRGVLGSTVLFENVKLDNFVHIAHGCKIGRNCMLTAKTMIAGSVTVGENVWFGPSSAVINGITIGDNSFLGLGAVVTKSVEEGVIVAGNPAKVLRRV